MQLQLKLEYEEVGQMWKVFKVDDKNIHVVLQTLLDFISVYD